MNPSILCALAALASCSVVQSADVACEWKTGKGTGLKLVKIADLSGKACLQECIKRKKVFKHINAVTEYKDEKTKGCWCIHKLHDISEGNLDFQTCHLEGALIKEQKPAEEKSQTTTGYEQSKGGIPHRKPGAKLPLISAPPKNKPDLTYSNFKNKECANFISNFEGCYQSYERRQLLFSFRDNIEWASTKISSFATSLRCACAAAAKEAGATKFALSYYGECWSATDTDVLTPSDDCVVADGLYKTKCSSGSNCLGTTAFALYKYFPTDLDKDVIFTDESEEEKDKRNAKDFVTAVRDELKVSDEEFNKMDKEERKDFRRKIFAEYSR